MTIDEAKTAMDMNQLCIYKREVGYTQTTPRSATENLIVHIKWVSDPFPNSSRVIHAIVAEGPYAGERHIVNEGDIESRLTLLTEES